MPLPVTDQAPHERGDAARNRALLLDAARRLIAERGADAVTMDDVAAAAGVGKGTVFRRFGSRAGLMLVLLDEDERAPQQAFLFGPPRWAPARRRWSGWWRTARHGLGSSTTHHALLSAAGRDPQTRHNAPANVLRIHIRVLLESAGTTGDLDAQADALLALLDADYVEYRLAARGMTLDRSETPGRAWHANSAAGEPCAGSCMSTSISSWPRWSCAAGPTSSACPSSWAATEIRPSRGRSSRARRTRPANSAYTPGCRCVPPPAAAPTPRSCRRTRRPTTPRPQR